MINCKLIGLWESFQDLLAKINIMGQLGRNPQRKVFSPVQSFMKMREKVIICSELHSSLFHQLNPYTQGIYYSFCSVLLVFNLDFSIDEIICYCPIKM